MRFELELKHKKTRLVQDYLFNNQLNSFEQQLVTEYFQYSIKVLCLNYPYSDWVVDFQRKHRGKFTCRSLVSSYIENQKIMNPYEEKRFFHLLQFLSFIRSLGLNPIKDCKKLKIKKQDYYGLKSPLKEFVNFTGIKISNHSERKNLIFYFYQLQKLDPIIRIFPNKTF